MAQIGNLPIVLMEGDRDEGSHAKKFDFDELKSLYNGRSPRAIGIKNSGNEKLIVKDLIPDCGCTLPKIDKKEFEPDEEGSVEVIFDSKGWQGSQSLFLQGK
jgi:hypothetical protein